MGWKYIFLKLTLCCDLREWFQVVSDQLFNPDFGLFVGSGIGGETVTINPQSGIANEHHLEYFRFAGRL